MPRHGEFIRDPVGWQTAFHSWGGTLGIWLEKKNEKLAAVARVEAPKSKRMDKLVGSGGVPRVSGTLAASIITWYWFDPDGELVCEVIANAKYAQYVHEGTIPHRIKADVPGKKIMFFWPSKAQVVFAKEIHHPGTKPNKFLHRAMAKVF